MISGFVASGKTFAVLVVHAEAEHDFTLTYDVDSHLAREKISVRNHLNMEAGWGNSL